MDVAQVLSNIHYEPDVMGNVRWDHMTSNSSQNSAVDGLEDQKLDNDNFKIDLHFVCVNCPSVAPFPTSDDLKAHIREFHETKCKMCPKIMELNENLKLLIASGKSKDQLYDCRFCGRKFSAESCQPTCVATLKMFKCDFCHSMFTELELLTNHAKVCTEAVKKITDEENLPLKLKRTRKRGRVKYNVDDAEKIEVKLEPSQYDDELETLSKPEYDVTSLEVDEESGLFECHICKAQLSSRIGVRRHIMVVHYGLKRFQCENCGRKFTSKHQMRAHIEKIHETKKGHPIEENLKPFQCELCHVKYYEKNTLVRHMRHKHQNPKPQTDSESFDCQYCGAKFVEKTCLSKHIHELHETLRLHECHMCDKTFLKRRYLLKHLSDVHKQIKKFKCRFCPQDYEHPKDLRLHLLESHKSTINNQCELCGKQLSCRASLWAHINAVHEKRQPFQCEHCGKNFAAVWQMKHHIRTVHLKLRPFQCHLCGMAFKVKNVLQRHIQNHGPCDVTENGSQPKFYRSVRKLRAPNKDKTEQPLGCPDCPQRFRFKNSLVRHIRKFHTENSNEEEKRLDWLRRVAVSDIECELCKKKFVLPKNLELHVKKCHVTQQQI